MNIFVVMETCDKKGEMMDILKCPNCGNVVLNNSKYCVKCGSYLLDDQSFLNSAVENVRKEKSQLLGDIYFVISDSVDYEIKGLLEIIAKRVEFIYDVFENSPYMHEDARLLICKTMDKTLSEVSDLTDLQRKKVEYRAQKVAVLDWLDTYQITLEEIKETLAERGESDIEVDIKTLNQNEAVGWFLQSN